MILAIDTSGGELLVCLLSADLEVMAGACVPGRRHQEVIVDTVERVIGGAERVSALGAIAVVRGPGSQTGLRVGLAAAAGLAFASRLELLPLSSLAVAAHRLVADGDLVAAVSAGRSNVYAQVFRAHGPGRTPVGPRVLAPALGVHAALGATASLPVAAEPALGEALGGLPPTGTVDGVDALANAVREAAGRGIAVAYHQLTGDYGE